MIKAYILYKDGTENVRLFKKMSTALETLRNNLDVGDSFVLRDGETLLATCKIENYKESDYDN